MIFDSTHVLSLTARLNVEYTTASSLYGSLEALRCIAASALTSVGLGNIRGGSSPCCSRKIVNDENTSSSFLGIFEVETVMVCIMVVPGVSWLGKYRTCDGPG